MDLLDSRRLTSQDAFVKVFGDADVYRYHVTAAPRGITSQHEPVFELSVRAGPGKRGSGTQHRVKVVWDDCAHHYVADPARLEIAQNDFVLWHCEQMAGSPPYAVRGQGKAGDFDSASLGPHAVFTHFFLQPGSYAYQVGGKGDFRVEVADHRKLDHEAYAARAKTAPVVTIRKGKPDPARVEVVAGQTVVWAVEDDVGVVISAARPGRPASA